MIDFLIYIGVGLIGVAATYLLIEEKERRRSQAKESISRTSQYKGVYYDRNKKRWKASVCVDGKRYNAGSFMSEEEAFYALQQLKAELNFER